MKKLVCLKINKSAQFTEKDLEEDVNATLKE